MWWVALKAALIFLVYAGVVLALARAASSKWHPRSRELEALDEFTRYRLQRKKRTGQSRRIG
jgi:hypothetical protein